MLFKNIIGDTQDTINAIQRFIERNKKETDENYDVKPADSINRIITSVANDDIVNDINKIIKDLK